MEIFGPELGNGDLTALAERAAEVFAALKSPFTEVRLPLCFEFAGSPKSGKSTVISLASLFLRRVGFRVSMPPEGASIETPPDLKDDLLAFNVWCGTYAIQNILVRGHEGDPADILILDRGPFDASVWMEHLHRHAGRIDKETHRSLEAFFLNPEWLKRIAKVFVLTADPETALLRERYSQLTSRPGRAMNAGFLSQVLDSYQAVVEREPCPLATIVKIDTSARIHPPDSKITLPHFQRIAFNVVTQMLDSIEAATRQELVVVDPVPESGFVHDPAVIARVRAAIERGPRFKLRAEAERTASVQQIVPYAAVKNNDGLFLCARRRTEGERSALAGKWTMLFGGHAERKDWDPAHPGELYRRCLERELDEELIGLQIRDLTLQGIVNDPDNEAGSKHLAFLHVVTVGGTAQIRRQTVDREFRREKPEWKTPDQIKDALAEFDPWSQITASHLFNIPRPGSDQHRLFG
jgi:predicted NUDIX family phosphoesterase